VLQVHGNFRPHTGDERFHFGVLRIRKELRIAEVEPMKARSATSMPSAFSPWDYCPAALFARSSRLSGTSRGLVASHSCHT
jgi:hypothetical protein